MSQRKFYGVQFILGLVGIVVTGVKLVRWVADHDTIDGRVAASIVLFGLCTYNLSHGLAGLLGRGRQ